MTIADSTIDRMVAMVRRMSALPSNPDRNYIEAREINALLPPPPDPDQDEVDALLQSLPNDASTSDIALQAVKLGRSLERGAEG